MVARLITKEALEQISANPPKIIGVLHTDWEGFPDLLLTEKQAKQLRTSIEILLVDLRRAKNADRPRE